MECSSTYKYNIDNIQRTAQCYYQLNPDTNKHQGGETSHYESQSGKQWYGNYAEGTNRDDVNYE